MSNKNYCTSTQSELLAEKQTINKVRSLCLAGVVNGKNNGKMIMELQIIMMLCNQ